MGDFPTNGSVYPMNGTLMGVLYAVCLSAAGGSCMRHLKGLKTRRKVVDSKEWLSEDYDVLAEREQMKKNMDARKLAELKLFRLDLMKRLNGK